uniref:Uncharacterized protein n=1 Tax=Ornithorhynchus anatinus TaxID=9258 RepID=A0A6I8P4M1_ORNAN
MKRQHTFNIFSFNPGTKCVWNQSSTKKQKKRLDEMQSSAHWRGPAEPAEYLTGPRLIYPERELPYYPGVPPLAPSPKGSYPRTQDMWGPDLRYPQYYPPPSAPQHKGPFRQDVPPSPPQCHKVPAYHEMGRTLYRGVSPDQYHSGTQDPRQKNPMTAAV